ncbi:hypothetical protein PENCOP_c010G00889 [Penicillium coprophilum]|uniref:Ketoreductase (KR) domain-containing protein n=1 Tax=Penicillium coprophilum TaxID=36646 RepID=A0A1V6UFP1_9EURO|nr:hypothetical protein PENCOP_c010G00889 [Penicillium coprophilum]
MGTKFDVTPEKQASVPRFFYNQLTVKPVTVQGVSLAGKTALVTGSNSGVGLETSRQLLDLGLSKLILAVRSEERGQTAKKKLSAGRNLSDDSIEVWNLDQSDYGSVVAFAERAKSLPRLDIVVLNIGIGNATRVFNPKTGHDEMIQVNYLSTALLTLLLLPIVKEKRAVQGGPSRITVVSSEVSAWTAFKEKESFPLLASLDQKNAKVDPLDRMMVSKLLGQFFLSYLASIVPPSVVIINAASPGSVHDSEFNREHDQTFSGAIAKIVMRRLANTAAVGARMITDAAVNHGQETHGEFLSFQKIVPLAPIIYTAEGKKISERLWKETEEELAFANLEEILRTISEGTAADPQARPAAQRGRPRYGTPGCSQTESAESIGDHGPGGVLQPANGPILQNGHPDGGYLYSDWLVTISATEGVSRRRWHQQAHLAMVAGARINQPHAASTGL